MAGIRPNSCYRHLERPFTRKSKYKSKAYIKAVPTSKLAKFEFGDLKSKFNCQIDIITTAPSQIRHNALESARTVVIRRLTEMGKSYRFSIRVHPHHILRENKMLTGAGADRMQTGMQLSFGRAIGLAARVKADQPIFTVKVDKADAKGARKALEGALPKLPGKCAFVQKFI